MRLAVYSDATELGGAEASLSTLLGALGSQVEVTVLAVDERVGHALAAARPGSPLVMIPPVRDKAHLRPIAAHLRALQRLRPDVLHVNLGWPWSGQYGIAAGLATPGVSVVAVEHAPAVALPTPWQLRFKRAMSRRLDAHVSVSEHAARALERLLDLPARSMRVIPNGVPAMNGTVPAPLGDGGPVVGSLGRLVPEKGYDSLVRALPALADTRLLLVGDGPARASLERLAAELGVAERVTITGWRDDARRWLLSMDLFVLPSHFESLPLSVIEAMLAGRAVVATDVGGLAELVEHGATGLLVPPSDDAALEGAIRRLLDDPDLRESFGSRGRALAVERFDPQAMGRHFQALYDEVT